MPADNAHAFKSPPFWVRQRDGIAFSDIPTHPGGRMPDFCIIGAAKAGTTALSAVLSSHPELFMCSLKEPHYFSTEAILARGDDWYRGLYADAGPDQLCGEASTSYTRYPFLPGTTERMATANSKMKLIYIIREPVARTESECLQTLKYAKTVLGEDYSHMPLDDFFAMIEDPDHPLHSAIIASSQYIDQIEAFDLFFPSEQLCIVTQEDFRADPKSTISGIFEFLGVNPGINVDTEKKSNVTSSFTSGLDRERTTARLRNLPFYNLARKLLPESAKQSILRLSGGAESEKILRFSDSLRERLSDGFVDSNARLATRLGNLPTGWN